MKEICYLAQTVKLIDADTEIEISYQIVGEYEADINYKKISIVSPLARALIGKSEGDFVEFATPKGTKSYEVTRSIFELIT